MQCNMYIMALIVFDKNEKVTYQNILRKLYKNIIVSFIKSLYPRHFNQKKSILLLKRAKSLKKNIRNNRFPQDYIKNGRRIAVYTCVYGGYDSIKPIKIKNQFCDYYIFTDQKVDSSTGWIKIDYKFPKDVGNNSVVKNRYIKMHPHLLFKEYDYSIYLDGNLTIQFDILHLMPRMKKLTIGLFNHLRGDTNLYDEANILMKSNEEWVEPIEKQVNLYKAQGFPKDFGFFECCLIIRKHHDKNVIAIMDNWWQEFIENKIKRDQLSFMYSVWKAGMTKNDIASLGSTIFNEPAILRDEHH